MPVLTADPLLELEQDWGLWLAGLFPEYLTAPFAEHQTVFWDWVWALAPGVEPRPFVAIWPRGGGKSTSVELAVAAVGATSRRRYVLYCSGTQAQADDHVQSVASLLESREFGGFYPGLADRRVGKFGNALGWRRNRLWTASGFVVDALGLDSAARGAKLEDARPDLIVLDDLDEDTDTLPIIERKIAQITRKILPAGSRDAAVLAVQNLVHEKGVFGRMVTGEADYLHNRILSGPHPALRNLVYRTNDEGRAEILSGDPTWAGQDLTTCQRFVDRFGLTSFLVECQHEVEDPPGGLFDHVEFRHCRPEDVLPLLLVEVWVDPAVSDKDSSDSHGIQADGLAHDGTIYRLRSWEGRTSPEDSLTRAVLLALELKATTVGVETDQGGDTWRAVYRAVCRQLEESKRVPAGTRFPEFRAEKAGAGHGPKVHRASQMLADYELGRIVHVEGTHNVLERALKRFPRTKPYDLVDAAFWGWYSLRSRFRPSRPPLKGEFRGGVGKRQPAVPALFRR